MMLSGANEDHSATAVRTTVRPCPQQGCRELTGTGPCQKHRHERAKQRYERDGSAAKRGYDHNWQRARALLLAREPLCRLCLFAHGELTVASQADHIVPIAAGGERLACDNMQPLCIDHHRRKSAAEWTADRTREHAHARCWIHLVCGPPRTGKSTLIASRRKPGDLLIDYDEIMRAVTGLALHEVPHPEAVAEAAHWLAYDALLAMLSRLTRLHDPGVDLGSLRPCLMRDSASS